MSMRNSLRAVLLCALLVVAGGVVTAQAQLTSYQASLSGPNESPPNSSPGLGCAIVDIDQTAHTLHVVMSFSDLTANTTAAHIHAPTTSPNTGTAPIALPFTGFPTGVKSGTYEHTFDLTLAATYDATFLSSNGGTAAGAQTALLNAVGSQRAYVNIHTTAFTGGEIRGFLLGTSTPTVMWTWGDAKAAYR